MRDMFTCPNCNGKVSYHDKVCPHCGYRNPSASSAAIGCFIMVVVIVGIAAIVAYYMKQ